VSTPAQHSAFSNPFATQVDQPTNPHPQPQPHPQPNQRVYQHSMYETVWWRTTVQVWELLMALCFGDYSPITWVVTALIAYIIYNRRRKRQRRPSGPGLVKTVASVNWSSNGAAAGASGSSSGVAVGATAGSSRLRQLSAWWGAGGGKKRRTADGLMRDLDV